MMSVVGGRTIARAYDFDGFTVPRGAVTGSVPATDAAHLDEIREFDPPR